MSTLFYDLAVFQHHDLVKAEKVNGETNHVAAKVEAAVTPAAETEVTVDEVKNSAQEEVDKW